MPSAVSRYLQFLKMAKSAEDGLGIGSAVEASLQNLKGDDGYISHAALVQYLCGAGLRTCKRTHAGADASLLLPCVIAATGSMRSRSGKS